MAESPTMEVRARLTADSAQFTKGLSEATKSAETFQSAASKLNSSLNALGAVAAGTAISLIVFATKSFKAAAEVQELDIALQAIGKSTRYGYAQLAIASEEIQNVGLSAVASRKAIIKLAQSNVDLTNATQLANIAQDLSVTASVNSADALNSLIFAITTGQTRMLRQIGITAGATEAFAIYGRTIGKSASDLTMAERRQAVLNLILKEGTKVQGAYALAIQSPSRALKEMGDQTRRLQEAVGLRLLNAFSALILSTLELRTKLARASEGTGTFSKVLDALEKVLTKLATPFTTLTTNIGNFIERIDKSKLSVNEIASTMEKVLPIAAAFATFFGIRAGKSLAQAAPFFEGFFLQLSRFNLVFTAFVLAVTSPQLRGAIGQLVTAFAPLVPAIQKLSVVFANLSALAIGVLAKAISTVASIVQTITSLFQNNARATQILVIAFTGIATAIAFATIAFYAHAAAIKIVTFTQALLAVGTVLLTGGQLSSIASTNGLAASMLKLNATMAANPIMRVVLIVGLLVTAIVTAYKNFETFRKVVNAVFNFVAKIVTVVLAGIITYYGHLLKTLAQVIRVFGFFAEVIAKVFEFVLDVILNFAKFVYTTYKNVIDAFITLMETNETFRKVVETVFNTIIRIIALAVTLIVTSFANILKAIATGIYIFEKLLDVAKTIVKGIIAGFVILGKGIFNIFKTVASGIGNFLGDALDTVKGWVMSLINLLSKIPGVDKLLQSVVASLNNFGSGFVNNLKNIGGKLSDALFGSTEKGSEQSINAITKVSKTLITNAKSWGNYSEGAAGAISNVANKMLDFNMKVVDLAAKDNGSKIVEGLIAGAKKASPFLEKIIAGLGTALKFDFAGTIGKFIDSVADKADEAGDKLIEFGKNMVIFAQNANFPEEIKDFIGNIRESLEEGLGFGDILKKEKDKADAIKAGGIDEDALNDIQGSADLMAKIREAMKAGIESMSDVLKDLQQAAKDFADSLKDTILGFAGLKSVELPDGFIPKAKSLIENMQTRLNKSNQFAQQITQLQALGLDAKAIQDLVESGPIKGAQLAASILGGGVDAIKQINEIQRAISITGAAIGKFGSEAAFGDKIANAQLKLAQVTDAEARISGVSGNNIVIEQGAFVVNVDTTGATNQDEKADIITQRIQETFAILAKELANK
jgi:phage-related protein